MLRSIIAANATSEEAALPEPQSLSFALVYPEPAQAVLSRS
ncbi:MAG: hypothetical protein OJF49_001884 [Ktedonobacterales bacterium]|nr:MAG: hypothetical protein OJF49_001884 [Ktedonobacterales bacterium]